MNSKLHTKRVITIRSKQKAKIVTDLLQEHYPEATKCYLNYNTPWQLLIATILSAQCTDERVNIVTENLFVKYPSIEAFANADVSELEKDIFSTGFYRNKAKNIILAMQKAINEYNGEIPGDIDILTTFPGVGRKTANVIRCHIYNLPGIIVDTHVKRISHKLGLTKNTDPDKIEFDLMKILPIEAWTRYNTQMIAHGRSVCKARSPECGKCFFSALCDWRNKQ